MHTKDSRKIQIRLLYESGLLRILSTYKTVETDYDFTIFSSLLCQTPDNLLIPLLDH